MIPTVFQFLLLTAIAYRVWKLIAEDDILNRPRKWLVRLPSDWEEDDPIPKGYRGSLADFLSCPWCAGAWVSLGVYLGYLATLGSWPDSTEDVFVGIGVWLALSCAVGLVRSSLDPPE